MWFWVDFDLVLFVFFEVECDDYFGVECDEEVVVLRVGED